MLFAIFRGLLYIQNMHIDNLTNDQVIAVELGRRIARSRLARNLSQGDLAARAGVSSRALWAVEHGEPSSVRTMVHILRALGMAGNLDLLVPEEAFSPLAVKPGKNTTKRRASPRRNVT